MADATPATRLKDDFFIKLVLARAAGVADATELIDRQRGAYLQALRELDDVAAAAHGDVTAALLIEGAALRLEADLKWLDLCEHDDGDEPERGGRHRRHAGAARAGLDRPVRAGGDRGGQLRPGAQGRPGAAPVVLRAE